MKAALVAERAGTRRVIPLGRLMAGAGQVTLTIADARQRGDTAYVVLWAYGGSRPGATSGPCSGGDEENLVWLAIGPDLRPDRTQSILTHSCLDNREYDGPPPPRRALTGDSLAFSVIDFASNRQLRLRYDRRVPVRGIAVDTLPVDP